MTNKKGYHSRTDAQNTEVTPRTARLPETFVFYNLRRLMILALVVFCCFDLITDGSFAQDLIMKI